MDRYSQLVRLPLAGTVAKRVGLPQPVELERGTSEVHGRVLLGGAGRVAEAAARVLAELGVDSATALDDPVRAHAAAAGLEVPFSCKSGVCCTCRAKLVEGEVRMERNFALEKHEVAAGYVLTCQSHPLTERVVLSFDER